jgi:hypothetical protein
MRVQLQFSLVVSIACLTACGKSATPGADTTATAASTTSTTASATVSPANSSAAPTSNDDKIKNAESAAPDSIAKAAAIMDWPATDSGKPTQLRAGTNGWVCYPSTPNPARVVGEDPMCLDPQFQKWAQAYLGKGTPKLSAIGVAYMLKGDRGASISDPYADPTKKPADWVTAGPHIMVAAPNSSALSSLPGKPSGGAPWVMWKGTPYAHIMVPVKS